MNDVILACWTSTKVTNGTPPKVCGMVTSASCWYFPIPT